MVSLIKRRNELPQEKIHTQTPNQNNDIIVKLFDSKKNFPFLIEHRNIMIPTIQSGKKYTKFIHLPQTPQN